jgi:hypothetical protein
MNRLDRLPRHWLTSALVATLWVSTAPAQSPGGRYPQMAPLDQYLMPDRDAEIAMAKSAAPAAVSGNARILVLGKRGYETAVEGTNGFVCMVERAWMSAFDDQGFWNPRIRGPVCYNPPAVGSVLPLIVRRTELVLSGLSKSQVLDSMQAGARRAAAPAAMAFMLSKLGYLGDEAGGPWLPHLMVYAPLADTSAWGADTPGSPVFAFHQFSAEQQPFAMFLVPVPKWSDGTLALRR